MGLGMQLKFVEVTGEAVREYGSLARLRIEFL